ncbi:MAG: glycosyl hydrolase family 28-related protein [bacterium]
MKKSIFTVITFLILVSCAVGAQAEHYPSTTVSALTADLNFNNRKILNVGDLVTRGPIVDVRAYGAAGDGLTDDTIAIQNAVDGADVGAVIYFPKGAYLLSDEIMVTKRLNFQGDGHASQLFQSNTSKSMFVIGSSSISINAMLMRDLYLASAATASDTALLNLTCVHRSRFDNVIMLGGYYGVFLKSSLCNTFVDLKTGNNIRGHFKQTYSSINQCWIYIKKDAMSSATSNANRFYNLLLEGGTNGIYFDGESQGGLSCYGGTIEGLASTGTSIDIYNNQTPIVISGVHFENSDGHKDINITNSCNVLVEGILGKYVLISSGANIKIANSYIGQVEISSGVKGANIENVKYNGSGNGWIRDHAADTEMFNLCSAAGEFVAVAGRKIREGKNIAVNGSLENWAGDDPSPFTVWSGATVEKTGIGLADTNKYAGSFSAKVTGAGKIWTGLNYTLPPFIKGQWITVEAWVYVLSGSASIGLYIDGGATTVRFGGTEATGRWERLVASFNKFTADNSSATLVLCASNNSVVYWDEVKIYVANVPSENIVTFDNGATSPSVAYNYYLTDIFQTANTSPTNITSFSGGYAGQKIIIKFTDTNTTVTNNGNIRTAGPFTSTTDDMITFVFDGMNWCETSRSINMD